MKKFSIFFTSLYFVSVFSAFSSSSQNSSLRQQTEPAIKQCEIQYQDLKSKEKLFDPGPKPKTGIFESKEKITNWNSKKEDLDRKHIVFKKRLWEMAEFTSKGKIKLRTVSEKDIVSESRDFISNCKRFYDGISEFVDWSLGKPLQNQKQKDVIYQTWMKD